MVTIGLLEVKVCCFLIVVLSQVTSWSKGHTNLWVLSPLHKVLSCQYVTLHLSHHLLWLRDERVMRLYFYVVAPCHGHTVYFGVYRYFACKLLRDNTWLIDQRFPWHFCWWLLTYHTAKFHLPHCQVLWMMQVLLKWRYITRDTFRCKRKDSVNIFGGNATDIIMRTLKQGIKQ